MVGLKGMKEADKDRTVSELEGGELNISEVEQNITVAIRMAD